MTIDPRGMTLERALEIATAALPTEPRYAPQNVRDELVRLYELGYSDGRIAEELGIPRHKVGSIRRGAGLTSNHHLKLVSEECPNGHPRTVENTYVNPRGWSSCRTCNNTKRRNTNREN